jgi:hypothetical protein
MMRKTSRKAGPATAVMPAWLRSPLKSADGLDRQARADSDGRPASSPDVATCQEKL